MNTWTRARLLALAITAPALLGATVVLVGQHAAVTSVPVCVKSNGQLRLLIEAGAACDTSEQRVDWVVGGEVTDITVGQGLIGNREDGTVQLTLDSSLLQRGRIFSGFNDGPTPLPRASDQTDIATLDLPAGPFAIFAKLIIVNNMVDGDSNERDRVICQLHALPDFDNGEILVQEAGFFSREATSELVVQLVHDFRTAGRVTLSCYEDDSILDLYFTNLKITAIEASSISNVFLEGS